MYLRSPSCILDCSGDQEYKMSDGKEVCFVKEGGDRVHSTVEAAEQWCLSNGYTGLWELRNLQDSYYALNLATRKYTLPLRLLTYLPVAKAV